MVWIIMARERQVKSANGHSKKSEESWKVTDPTGGLYMESEPVPASWATKFQSSFTSFTDSCLFSSIF